MGYRGYQRAGVSSYDTPSMVAIIVLETVMLKDDTIARPATMAIPRG
jgi:hypothetical protein